MRDQSLHETLSLGQGSSMNANRFYSIPFDARNDTAMLKLRRKAGGIIAFGRWQALLGILYDEDGCIDLTDEDNAVMVASELDFDSSDELSVFLDACAKYGLISLAAWEERTTVISEGVAKEIDYRKQKSEAGRKGGAASAKTRTKKQ